MKKFITFGYGKMGWLVQTVEAYIRLGGSSKFYTTSHEGNRTFLDQCCSNFYGRYLVIAEHVDSGRHGFIVVLEGCIEKCGPVL